MEKTKNVEIVLFLVTLVVLVMADPDSVNIEKSIETKVESLPFLQFTNGGLGVNFAGYHAEAGLGGLLGGANAGGGLHASAGTPWGAHAFAGLRGLLSGDTASADGGLHARAGLGSGGPEAAAGLGGALNGSASAGANAAAARAEGRIFADATAENMEIIRKNVQIINPTKKIVQKEVIAPARSADLLNRISAETSADTSVSSQTSSITLTEKKKDIPAAAAASLVGGLYADVSTGGEISKTDEKMKIPVHKNVIVQKNVVYSVPSSISTIAQGDESTIVIQKPVRPASWYYRKRIQVVPLKKTVVSEAGPSLNGLKSAEGATSASVGLTEELSMRTKIEGPAEGSANASKYKNSSTFFDDIFNVSTIDAENNN